MHQQNKTLTGKEFRKDSSLHKCLSWEINNNNSYNNNNNKIGYRNANPQSSQINNKLVTLQFNNSNQLRQSQKNANQVLDLPQVDLTSFTAEKP